MKTVNITKLIAIALVAMLGLVALSFSGVLGSASKYSTFADAKQSKESVHVVGKWVNRNQTEYDVNQDLFQFYMQDTADVVSLVRFHNPEPQNFRSAEKIVIEGQYKDNYFEADNILMKCPSKYNENEFTVEEASAS